MTDVTVEREKAVLPDGLTEGFGHFVPLLLVRQQISEGNFDARTVNQALQDIYDSLARPAVPNLLTLAKVLGAGYFVGTVDSAADSVFEHNLGRTPTLIVHSVDILGGSGRVIGRPEAGGPNDSRWTSSSIYVRSTATARYAFFVI